jgi:hypothetical protein
MATVIGGNDCFEGVIFHSFDFGLHDTRSAGGHRSVIVRFTYLWCSFVVDCCLLGNNFCCPLKPHCIQSSRSIHGARY